MNEGTLVPMPAMRKPDAELAALHRKTIEEALGPVLKAMDAAKADGFSVSWAIGMDYAGRNVIGALKIAKEY